MSYNYYFIVLSFLCMPFSLTFGQGTTLNYKELDSLINQYELAADYEQGIIYAQIARKKATKELGIKDSLYHKYTKRLGYNYSHAGQHDEAEPLLIESKELDGKRFGKESMNYASSLNDLAYLYFNSSKFSESESLYLKAIDICSEKRGKKDLKYASYIDNLAVLYMKMGKPESEALLLEAKAIRAEVLGLESDVYANSLNNLGAFYQEKGLYAQAESAYLEAQRVFAKTLGEKHPKYAFSVHNLASFYKGIGQYKKALPFCKKAVEIRKKILGEKHQLYWYSQDLLASIYSNLGQYEEAETIYKTVEKMRLETMGEGHLDYSYSINSLATFYQKVGQYSKAEAYYLKSLSLTANYFGKRDPKYAKVLETLAGLYVEMGNLTEAEPLLLDSKNIIAESLGEKHPRYASVLGLIAHLYRQLGQFSQAIPFYEEVVSIRAITSGKNNAGYSTSLNNLGLLYRDVENFAKAKKLLKEAQAIRETIFGTKHPMYANSLNNLALVYRDQGDVARAEPLYQETLEILKATMGEHHPYYALTLNNLAELYKKPEDLHKAEALLLESKAIRAKVLGIENPTYSASLSNLAALYQRMGKLDLARDYCRQSLDANSSEIDSTFVDFTTVDQYDYYSAEQTSKCMTTLVQIEKKRYLFSKSTEDLEELYRITKAGMRLNENIRNDFSHVGDKLRSLRSNNYFVSNALTNAILLKDQTRIEEAFSFSELNKSILLSDAIKGQRARSLGDLPDSLSQQEIELQKRLSIANKEQIKAKTAAQKTTANKVLLELNMEIETFIKSLKSQYPKYHALKYANITANAKDVQNLLDEASILVEYFNTDSLIYLFVISKTSVELMPLAIDKSELKKQIKNLRKALSNYTFIAKQREKAYKLYVNAAYWFYQNLLEQALKDKQAQKLIVITDGELGHIPFETFLCERGPQKGSDYEDLHYLINDYAVSYNYSATLWKENLSTKTRTNNGQILACAAAYPKTDSTLSNLRSPATIKLRKALQPLPAAQEEVRLLSELFQGDFLFGTEANEAFFKANAEQYGVIHLAMHGVLHPKVAMFSSMAFTENQDSLEDNFLHAYEISKLNLNANLVVLSACETGYGKFEQGEGIVSIARSFMYAGVPSLVVSLWPVNDYSTSSIMNMFYENLAQGQTKDIALQAAKLEFIKQAEGIASHPAFWSPFIQLGDTKAIRIAPKSNAWWWLTALAVFVVVGVGGLAWKRKRT